MWIKSWFVVQVTIRGVSLFGSGDHLVRVLINGVPARILNESDTEIIVTAASSVNGSGIITLVSDTGAIVTSAADAFTYFTDGIITNVTPSIGQYGTRVTIAGEGLLGGGSRLVSVHLQGVQVERIVSSTSEIVVIDAGRGATLTTLLLENTSSIVLTADSGATVSSVDGWAYTTPGIITSVDPPNGQYGTLVTISGTNLLQNNSSVVDFVLLSGIRTEHILSQNDTVIIAEANSSSVGRNGTVVAVLSSGAIIDSPSKYWVYETPQSIVAVVPSSGHDGTIVTITGDNLLGGGTNVSNVRLGGVAADVVSGNDTEMVVIARASPQNINSSVTVKADTGATVTADGVWTYIEPAVVTLVFPSSGQNGTRVDIIGSRLKAGGSAIVAVTLAGVEATVGEVFKVILFYFFF